MTKIALTENSQTGERISYGWNDNIEVAAHLAFSPAMECKVELA